MNVLALLVIVVAVTSPLQPPRPTENGDNQQSERAQPTATSESLPPSSDGSSVSDSDSQGRHGPSPWAWPWAPIDVFTAVLVLFTSGLLWVGYAQVTSTYRLERPWIRVRLKKGRISKALSSIDQHLEAPFGYAVPIRFCFENDGRSPALIWSVSINFKFIPDPECDEPPYDTDVKDFPDTPVSPGQQDFFRRDKRYLGTADVLAFLKSEGSFRFFCIIKYRDVVAPRWWREHETRFSWGFRAVEADETHKALGFDRVVRSQPMGGPKWNAYT